MPSDEPIDRALRENGLNVAYRPDVESLIRLPRSEWPVCCGGFCEPCALALGRAAERAIALAAEEKKSR